ncbi:Coagulation factor XI-like protein, partial [Daphnia magna]
ILASVDCQLRVKVIRPESVVAETRFNWSSIQQKNSFPTETLRFYQYGQLPAQQNARQPICDQRYGLPYERAALSRVMGGTSTKPNQFSLDGSAVDRHCGFLKTKTSYMRCYFNQTAVLANSRTLHLLQASFTRLCFVF